MFSLRSIKNTLTIKDRFKATRLGCDVMQDFFVEHVATCPVCRQSVSDFLSLASELPIISNSLDDVLKGKSINDLIDSIVDNHRKLKLMELSKLTTEG